MTLSLDQQDTLFARIGEERMRRTLWAFYARVVQDDLLGPVFVGKIGPFPKGGWPIHMLRLEGFWRAVLGAESAYKGQPGPAHMGLGADERHFERWLQLWAETLNEHLEPPEAETLVMLASRMRVNLQRFALLGQIAPQETP